MDNDIKNLLTDISTLLDTKLQPINEKLYSLEQGQNEIKLTLENQTNKNIQLLVEGYMGNIDKIEKLDFIAEDVSNINLDIKLLKNAILHNTEEITRLKMIK
ncbi:hypothetical protein [Anaerotignum propionicum]|uniref:Uncharacterized protein n=1 Tax=Anaerotignum propionicum DSM 1682 TaxID=991789 RepID=A0A0X8VEK9_ANAPI|nr:hypothetical protein [Anaerotignum propionicum]AMJ42349.1 hypothetical protein CPRO_28050 [Anaerotignum propionicum DSM 1682]SHF00154.1 hypothetical protein SAMN02745151_02461 [[Clostridium] propionicum DSM 1682] [Anaerotignum propionicum DSM 1682]